MTKKDYELIAKAIREARVFWNKEHDLGTTWVPKAHTDSVLGTVTVVLTHMLADDNPRFDRKRFFDACHLGDEAILGVQAGKG